MIPEGTSPEAIVSVVIGVTVVFCVIAAAFFWYRLPESFRLFAQRVVNRFLNSDTHVMSHEPISASPSLPLSPRQTAPQTDRPKEAAEPSREIMLDMFRLMREYGIPREKARPILKAAGWKLDNNLWTEAAPPESEYTTPIAGRTTRAQFDPDFPYEPLN